MADRDMSFQCVQCGTMFLHTSGAQKFFKEKGFELPKRCKPCRDERKQQKDARR